MRLGTSGTVPRLDGATAVGHMVPLNMPLGVAGKEETLFIGQWSSWLHSAKNSGSFPRNNAFAEKVDKYSLPPELAR